MSQSRNRTENAKRIIASNLFRQMLGTLAPFLMRSAMIYSMSSLYLGINGLFASILQMLNLAELGFGEALVFSMYKPLADGDEEKVCALMNLYRRVYRIIGGAVLAAGLMLMPFLRRLISGEIPADINLYIVYLLVLCDTTLSYFTTAHRTALFYADQRGNLASVVSIWMQIVLTSLQIFSVLVLHNYYLFCVSAIVSQASGAVVTYYLSRRFYPNYVPEGILPKEEVREIWKKISGLFINKVCYVLRNAFDSVTVSAFIGLNAVAIFQNYFSILNAVTKGTTILSSSILAGVGNSMVLESKKKNYRDFQKFQLLFMWVAGWCTVCLFCLYQPFMGLWMGQERMLSEISMAVYCVYYFVDMMGVMCFIYRQAAGLYQYRKLVPVLEALTNVALNVLLVRRFGVVGVLLSTIFCLSVIDTAWNSGVLFDFYFTEESRTGYLLRLAFFAAVTAAACAVTRAVCALVPLSGIPELLVKGCICVVVPNGVYLCLFRMLEEYQDAKKFVQQKLLLKR